MKSPLFPIRPSANSDGESTIFVIEPHRHEGAWVFDDAAVGLRREPFVAGITEMIDRLVAEIPGAAGGFRLLFAAHPFEGYQATLLRVRADPVGDTGTGLTLRLTKGGCARPFFAIFNQPRNNSLSGPRPGGATTTESKVNRRTPDRRGKSLMHPSIPSVFELSLSEKLQLVEDLWDDIAATPEAIPVHDWQKEELDRRKANLQANPASGLTWEAVQRRVRQQYGR